MIEYCAGFAFDSHLEYVALVRKSHPNWQRGRLNAIGGHIEVDETPISAQRREFLEETGRDIDTWQKFCVLSGGNWRVNFFWTVCDLDGMTNFARVEPIEVHSTEYSRAMIHNLRWLIPMAQSIISGQERAKSFSVDEL